MRKLTEKEKNLFKLVVWACLMVWMLFFFTYSIIAAQKMAVLAPMLFGGFGPTWGAVLTWVAPVWIVFTALLLIVFAAKFAHRRLNGKPSTTEN